MWKPHPNFNAPHIDTKIWRYVDFTKLVRMLETRSLFFARSDRFDDPFEGSYPRFNVLFRDAVYGNKLPQKALEGMVHVHREVRRFVAINCWHMNSHESAAMWRLYLKSNEGIAIQSTYGKLISSLSNCEEDVFVGIVRYVDYDQQWMPEGNMFYPFLHKRKSFEHEKELRAMIARFPVLKTNERLDVAGDTIAKGIEVPCDISELVQEVYVAPSAPGWFASLVELVVRRYDLQVKVTQSSLDQAPVY